MGFKVVPHSIKKGAGRSILSGVVPSLVADDVLQDAGLALTVSWPTGGVSWPTGGVIVEAVAIHIIGVDLVDIFIIPGVKIAASC